MEGLCTSCLVEGRLLHGVREDGDDADQLYRQIMSEVDVTQCESASVSPRVCWECRAVLHRFTRFKQRALAALQQLLDAVRQGGDATDVARAPTLRTCRVAQVNYSPDDVTVKCELAPAHPEPESTRPEAAVSPKPEPDARAEPETHVEPAGFACTLVLEDEEWDAADDVAEEPPPETSKRKPKVKTKPRQAKKPRNQKPQIANLKPQKASLKAQKASLKPQKASLKSQAGAKPRKAKTSSAKEASSANREEEDKDGAMADGLSSSLPKPKLPQERPICTECGKQFSSRKTYRYHINVLHKGQNRYPCPHCGKEYQWKSNLWRHIKNHKAVASGELYCAPCDRRFSSVATLRQHQRASRTHVRETDYSFMCTTCGARFVSAARLRDHVDWEHLQRARHRCRLCDKAFKSGTSLSAHAKTVHARATRLLCHVCGQRYQSAAKLKYHISAMHTRAFPYSCSACGAVFRWYSSLYRHARQLHDKVKPPKKPRSRPASSPRQQQQQPAVEQCKQTLELAPPVVWSAPAVE